MALVKDIMTPQVLTIDPDEKLEDVAAELTKMGITGAPVRDEQGHVVGVLSKSDLADAGRVSPSASAKDAMTPLLFATKAEDTVRSAAARMVETGSHRLVVVSDSEVLVGIVTPMDVLKGLLDGRVTAGDFQKT